MEHFNLTGTPKDNNSGSTRQTQHEEKHALFLCQITLSPFTDHIYLRKQSYKTLYKAASLLSREAGFCYPDFCFVLIPAQGQRSSIRFLRCQLVFFLPCANFIFHNICSVAGTIFCRKTHAAFFRCHTIAFVCRKFNKPLRQRLHR